ncbi:MAG: O-antigen ligase family protein [Bacteroides sp.]|nr:O-antigen ligase family protein [Bacteroides sp.]
MRLFHTTTITGGAFLFLLFLPFCEQYEIWGGYAEVGICLGISSLLLLFCLFEKESTLTITPTDKVLLGLAVWVLLRNLFTNTYSWGAFFVFLYLLLLYGWGKLLGERCKTVLLLGVLGAGVIQSALAWLQLAGVTASHHAAFLCTGSYHNPAPLGGVVALALVASLYLYRKTATLRYLRVLLPVVAVGMLPVLVASDSRAAWLATGVGVSVFLFQRWKIHLAWKIVSVEMVLLLVALPLYRYKQTSADARLLIGKVCLEMVKREPWWGEGAQAVKRNYMPTLADYLSEQGTPEEKMQADNNIYAFNEGLTVLCAYGIVGLVLLGTALFLLVRDEPRGSPSVGVLAAYGTFALFAYPFSMWSLLSYFVLLLSSQNSGRKWRPRRTAKMVGAAGVFLILIGYGIYAGKMQRINQALNEYCWERKERVYLNTHFHSFANETPLVAGYAKVLFINKQSQEAIPVLKQLVRLRPTLEVYMDLGVCHREVGAYEEARHCFETGSRMLPAFITPRYQLFRLYRCMGDEEAASKEAENLRTMPVKVENEKVRRMRGVDR